MLQPMRILFIGEVVGGAGVYCIKALLPGLKRELDIDLTIASAEGATGGFGLGKGHSIYLHKLGVDVITTGDFAYFKRDMVGLSPFGKAVPESVRAEILKAKQGFIDDTLKLYTGPLKDSQGNVILEQGQAVDNEDTEFKLGVRFFVEGAIGETGLN